MIQTIDDFQNQSETVIPFIKNFNKPALLWSLKPPSFIENNQWYSNKTAQLNLQTQNSVSYWLNGKSLTNELLNSELSNNSELKAIDSLGNETTKSINWVEYNPNPEIIVETPNKTYIDAKKINVKMGEKIYIHTKANAVGSLNSEYGNNKDWFPLPKTFVFIDTGLYRLYIKSNDKIGNITKSYIVFKITK